MKHSTISTKTLGIVSVVVGLIVIAAYFGVLEVMKDRRQPEEVPDLSSHSRAIHGTATPPEKASLTQMGVAATGSTRLVTTG